MFVAIAVPLSLHEILLHVLHYTTPDLQRHAIRILGMIPIYAIESWCALRFKEQALVFETLREAYEAYVIWSFFRLLHNFLGDYQSLKERMRANGQDSTKLFFPLCCVRWQPAGTFLYRTSLGVLQYVFVRLTMSILTLVLAHYDLYGEGEFSNFRRGYVYIVVILTVSQGWAMYMLVVFYKALSKELAPLRPFLKFLVVKSVVFVSFYQQIMISLLVFLNVIKPTFTYTQEEVAKGLQDFLICIEVALAAIAQHYAFSYKEMLRPELAVHLHAGRDEDGGVVARHHGLGRALRDMVPLDIVRDTRTHIVKGFRGTSQRLDLQMGASGGATTAVVVAPAGPKDARGSVVVPQQALAGIPEGVESPGGTAASPPQTAARSSDAGRHAAAGAASADWSPPRPSVLHSVAANPMREAGAAAATSSSTGSSASSSRSSTPTGPSRSKRRA